jgi:hypothetical protein
MNKFETIIDNTTLYRVRKIFAEQKLTFSSIDENAFKTIFIENIKNIMYNCICFLNRS